MKFTHAIIRQNYCCSRFVERDHADAGEYYGAYDAQLTLSSILDTLRG